jgi:hypothetical protein
VCGASESGFLDVSQEIAGFLERHLTRRVRACRQATGASTNLKEVDMTTFAWHKITTAAAALAFAAALASPAVALAATHSHDAATPHALSLNQGRKWATDEPLRKGMERIRGLVEARVDDAHSGKLGAAHYRDLALQVEAEVGTIVANCKLEPKADAMLHLVIADLLEGAGAMAGKNPKLRSPQGLNMVVVAVNEYSGHFEHPGFKPISTAH